LRDIAGGSEGALRGGASDRCLVSEIAARAVSETFMKSQRQRGG
jgi:hypothetical protein